MSDEFININIDKVVVGKRPRNDDGDLSVLENSIRAMGLLHPIVVDSENVLISGGRRLQSCRNLGQLTIAARRLDIKAGSMQALDVQTDENLCRQELTPEEMDALIEAKRRAAGRRAGTRSVADFFTALKSRFSTHKDR